MNYGMYGDNCLQHPLLQWIPQEEINILETACLCLNHSEYYGNNLRKTLIKSCKDKGFKMVLFMEEEYIPYFGAMKNSFYIPENGDFVWIFDHHECSVYHRVNGKAKFNYQCNEDYSKTEVLMQILEESKLIPNNCLFYSSDDKINKEKFAQIFPLCKCHTFVSTPWKTTYFALIKADSNLKRRLKCETFDLLTRNICVEYRNKKIIEVLKYQNIPLKVFYKVSIAANNSVIYVDEEEKRLFGIKKHESYNVPVNLKSFYIFLKVDNNGIYSIKYLSSPVISISRNVVTVYNILNEETTSFNAASDYGFNEPIMNVNYSSVTTINEPLKYFEREYENNNVLVAAFLRDNVTDLCYIIDIDGRPKCVSTKRVIIDIFKYVTNRFRISIDSCIITYPPHFTNSQKQVFMKCIENAGLRDSIFVDEQIALAYGCEQEYEIPVEHFYIIVHYSDPKICISMIKVGIDYEKEHERILLEAEDFESNNDTFFDAIIEDNNAVNNDFEDMLENCLLSISNLLEAPTIQTVYVTRESLLFKIISESFPETRVTFIEYPETLIAKGALYGYDIPEDSYIN